jgi:hypothetical protein
MLNRKDHAAATTRQSLLPGIAVVVYFITSKPPGFTTIK